jgi:pilus assembly protein CpaD
MITNKTRSLCSWAGILIAAALLSACAAKIEGWSPSPAPKTSSVGWVVSVHEVRFEPNSDRLAPGELVHLDRFLGAMDLRRPSHIFVDAGASASTGGSTLDGQRRDAVDSLLLGYDLMTQFAPPRQGIDPNSPTMARSDEGVLVLVGRYTVSTPGCPDWTKPTISDFDNQKSSNFGCATATNLGMMVADPRDLIGGSPVGAHSGERAANVVARYRRGESPALPTDTGTAGQASTTGSQGG